MGQAIYFSLRANYGAGLYNDDYYSQGKNNCRCTGPVLEVFCAVFAAPRPCGGRGLPRVLQVLPRPFVHRPQLSFARS